MKKFLVAVGLVALLTACGGGDAEPTPEPETDEGAGEDAGAGAGGEETDADATAARATYEKSCIGCHGGNLEGGVGPALTGTGLSAAEIEDIIHNGTGAMAAQNVDDADAANLAAWIAEQ